MSCRQGSVRLFPPFAVCARSAVASDRRSPPQWPHSYWLWLRRGLTTATLSWLVYRSWRWSHCREFRTVQHVSFSGIGITSRQLPEKSLGSSDPGNRVNLHIFKMAAIVSVVRTTSKVNGKCQISRSASSETLGSIFKKIAQLITSWTPPHMQILGSIGSKGACLRMREIVTLRRLFFSFLGSMRLATGRPVGPIVAVNGLNDASSWSSRPFYGFVNKKYFSVFFTQKCEKLHYTLWELWRAKPITLAPLKIRTRCLHQTGSFRGRPI